MSAARLSAAIAGVGIALAIAELLSGPRLPAVVRGHTRWLSSSALARRLKRERLPLEISCAVIGSLAALVLTNGVPVRIAILLATCAAVGGFAAPSLWLARRLRRRLNVALRELPDMLDLLCVTLEAGQPPIRALSTVAAEFSGPLAREWTRVSAEAELGLPRDQALAGLAARLPHDDVRAFAEALRRSHRHGTPLARLVASHASRARHRRAQQMREQAARAGPKIQLVVALLLVPSALLIVAAGLVAELGRAGLAGVP
jgi:tight adherence protein C